MNLRKVLPVLGNHGKVGNYQKTKIVLLSHEPPRRNPSGYGQAVTALAEGLNKIGCPPVLIAPYRAEEGGQFQTAGALTLELPISGKNVLISVEAAAEGELPYLAVRNSADDRYFEPDSLFAPGNIGNYGGGALTEAALTFNLAAFEIAKAIGFSTSEKEIPLIHGHDHLTALAVLMAVREGWPTVFTVHNPAYTSLADFSLLRALGLEKMAVNFVWRSEPIDLTVGLEDMFKELGLALPPKKKLSGDRRCDWGGNQVDLLALAMGLAGVVTTVSESYADEIKGTLFSYGATPVKYGELLNGRWRSFFGIPTALPSSIMERIKPVRVRQTPDEPVNILFANRLTEQKGYHFLFDDESGLFYLKRELENGLHLRFTVMAEEQSHGNAVGQALQKFAGTLARNKLGELRLLDYSRSGLLAEFARSDLAVQPSLFEPFGLFALAAQAHGVIPLVSYTGGLKDLISDNSSYYPKFCDTSTFPYVCSMGGTIDIAPYGLSFGALPENLSPDSFWRGLMLAAILIRQKSALLEQLRIEMMIRAREMFTPEKMAEQYYKKAYSALIPG